jgi:hypothetical protein
MSGGGSAGTSTLVRYAALKNFSPIHGGRP